MKIVDWTQVKKDTKVLVSNEGITATGDNAELADEEVVCQK